MFILMENIGLYSEKQGQRFHQDILDFERCNQRQYNEKMMGDHVSGLLRESDLLYNVIANLRKLLISKTFVFIYV